MGNLGRHSELAAKAGGISFHRFVLPIRRRGVSRRGAMLALEELAPARPEKKVIHGERGLSWTAVQLRLSRRARMGLYRAHARLEGQPPLTDVVLTRQGTAPTIPHRHHRRQRHLGQHRMAPVERIEPEAIVNGADQTSFKFKSMRLLNMTELPSDLLSRNRGARKKCAMPSWEVRWSRRRSAQRPGRREGARCALKAGGARDHHHRRVVRGLWR